jgi:D-3-phosphoglycerate dehydrogenase
MEKLQKEFRIRYINATGARLSERDLIEAVHDTEFIIAGTEAITGNVINASPSLKGIARVGVGIDTIDLKAAQAKKILIMNTPEAPVQAVAEHTVALLLAAMKGIARYNENMRKGRQSIEPGMLLAGKQAGIIGLGRIGHAVASLLSAFGCRIGYFDPFTRVRINEGWTSFASLADLAAGSEIITIHAAPQEDGRALLDKNFFSSCKKGVVLINTARGSLIDEAALETALEDGTVSAAGLDVFSSEPYSGPLLNYPQVIATPHVSSNTHESRRAMEMEAVENLIRAKRRMME